MSLWLSGIGVSRGIAIGRVQKLHGDDLDIPHYRIAENEVEGEILRFRGALQKAKQELREIRNSIPKTTSDDVAAFIDTHLLMMEDRSISEATVNHIREDQSNAEAALCRSRDILIAVFERIEDPYLRTRRDDVAHVCTRILRILLTNDRAIGPSLTPGEPTVIVADDITPADIILLSQQASLAFVTEYGGPLSHTAILARSLRIPAIVGLHNARRLLRDGETVVVDGETGHLLADPESLALAFYRRRQTQQAENRQRLTALRDKPAVSRDGVRIHLLANVELPEDAAVAVEQGAEGIGLHRTEFLYMNRSEPPGEEEQFQAYTRLIGALSGPVTIRTLDLGADKQVDSGRSQGPTPNNPALGLRAIRLCLKEQDLFRTQLRALLRASGVGPLKIMLPMISNLNELRQTRVLIEQCRAELVAAGIAVADQVPVGAMIEVPAAAIAAPLLAAHCSFFSIGTNDLIQYTLAIDRVDDEVNYLYDPLHPAVLQLIRQTIAAGESSGIPVSMCGEMAGDIRYTRLLLGLGLTEFSMHPANLLEVKSVVREADVGQLRASMAQILEAMTTGDADTATRLMSALQA